MEENDRFRRFGENSHALQFHAVQSLSPKGYGEANPHTGGKEEEVTIEVGFLSLSMMIRMRSTMNSLVSEDHPSQVLLNDVCFRCFRDA